MQNLRPTVVAYYLGQYRPTQENDEFWGSGFTEWHNVARARPLFPGHMQPVLPGALGFYDLRCTETLTDQIKYASQIGVDAFCYWHYWFAGKRMLHEALDKMLESDDSGMKFMLGWANESWTGVWHGAPGRMLIEQKYDLSELDHHASLIAQYIRTGRYLKVGDKFPFVIYKPRKIPDARRYLGRLKDAVRAAGGGELYLVGNWGSASTEQIPEPSELGLDAVVITPVGYFHGNAPIRYSVTGFWAFLRSIGIGPEVRSYNSVSKTLLRATRQIAGTAHATVVSGWDNTPHSGRRGLALLNYSEDTFQLACRTAIALERRNSPSLLFVKSWNEWAEGNVLEPRFQETWSAGRILKATLNEV